MTSRRNRSGLLVLAAAIFWLLLVFLAVFI
jgi:hypothetical protein